MTPLTAEEKAAVQRYCGYPTEKRAFDGWDIFNAIRAIETMLAAVSGDDLRITRHYLKSMEVLEADVARTLVDGASEYQALFTDWRERLCEWMVVPQGPLLTKGGKNNAV